MTSGAEEKLARVTYLPGVMPPSAPLVSTADAAGSRVPLETIPGLVRASQIGASQISASQTGASQPGASQTGASQVGSATDDLPGKRFAGHTGEIEPLTARVKPDRETETRSSRAHNVSLNALARRGVSAQEMAELLERRELDDGEICLEMGRLQRVGLIDDEELARTLIRSFQERKGLGKTAIVAELRRRKIDQGTIDEAIEEYFEEEGVDELTRARELAMKRAPQLRSLDPETARRRLGAFLMRKGYSGSIVASAVAAALAPNHPTVRGPRFQ